MATLAGERPAVSCHRIASLVLASCLVASLCLAGAGPVLAAEEANGSSAAGTMVTQSPDRLLASPSPAP